MKKSLLSLAAVALMMSACTQDVAELEGGNVVNYDGNVGVTAVMTPETRTAMTENAAGSLEITWVAEDAIGLTGEDSSTTLGENVKYTANSSAAITTFSCAEETPIKWGEGEHKFYAYYPYTSEGSDYTAVPASVPAVQEQSAAGNTDHLQPYSFLYASYETNGIPADGNIDLQFKSAFSVLELQVCAEAGEILCDGLIFRADDASEKVSASNVLVDLTDGSLDYSAATTSNQIKIDLGEGVTLNTTTPKKFYMLITPGHGGKRFSFYAVVGGKKVLLGNKGIPAAGLPAGRKAQLSLNVPVVNLSADGTANCYIVNKAGTTYKFKATVMGNGYKGMTTGLSQATGISSTRISPASASLVWATGSKDKPLATDIQYKEDYIYFTTPDNFVNGNAVIAAKDANGTILWSWHIWALENYDVEANLVTVTSKAVEGDAYAGQWIDRNIGAMNNNPNGDLNAYGMYYQWGRKDPFAIANQVWWADGSRSQAQPTLADMGNETKWVNRGGSGATTFQARLQDAITHPDYYITGVGNVHNWASSADLAANDENVEYEWETLWGNPNVNWWADANALGSKSIFDPCPVGYKLPANSNYRFISGIQADTYGNLAAEMPWRWNCVEIANMTPGSANAPTWTNYQRGFNFYIEDHHTGSDGAWTHKSTGKTWFFPSAGMAHYNGFMQHGGTDNSNGIDRVALWVNQPVAIDSKEGSRLTLHNNGTIGGIQYVFVNNNYCSGQACAAPVRCIKDKNFVPTTDNKEIDLSEKGTSNCYIVNKANTAYKFKATVKGNGVTALTGESANITPTKAYLLWAQNQPLAQVANPGGYPAIYGDEYADKLIDVQSVSLNDGYIYFNTGADMPNGNAVIAATDADGNIVWSWHLWVVKDYEAANKDYYVTAENINAYMMDRNLGATSNPADVTTPNINDYVAARGMYYQWGRKDPIVGNLKYNGYAVKGKVYNAYGDGTKLYMNYGNDRLFKPVNCATESKIYNDIYKIVEWTVSNPVSYMTAWKDGINQYYGWIAKDSDGTTEEWGKLWGNQGWTNSWDKGGVKTMYDPCPVGYRVPSTGHFTFITAHNDQLDNNHGQFRNWKYNCLERIHDEDGVLYGTHVKNAPYGLNFYYNGVKKETSSNIAENVQDYGIVSSELKTLYIPAQGLITYSNTPWDENIYLQTNAPATGQTRWMKMEDGNIFYNATSGSYDQQAKALPVRCVRE